jgi:hypothetical protein
VKHILQGVSGATQIRHVATSGQTPGWDVEYIDARGQLNAVEVKGTSGAGFPNFIITQGELQASRELGQRSGFILSQIALA